MRSSVIVGAMAGGLVSAVAVMALHGDFQARNVRMMKKKMMRTARRMGIDL